MISRPRGRRASRRPARPTIEREMCGLEWGRLYKAFHNNAYNPAELNTAVQELFGDAFVKNRKGIYEYLLGGATDARLLDVRVFEESTKRAAYKTQTDAATEAGTSTAHFVLSATTLTRTVCGSSQRWTPTTWQRGAKAARQSHRTARCCAGPTIRRRGAGSPVAMERLCARRQLSELD